MDVDPENRQDGNETARHFQALLRRNRDSPVRVGQVDVRGFVHTDVEIFHPAIDRVMAAETFGDIMKEINALASYMQRLDIFKSVDALLDLDPNDPREFIVVLQVEEKGRVGLKTETQLGQQEAEAGVSGVLRNFLGRGENLSGTYSVGTKAATSYQLRFTRPLYDETQSFDVNVFRTTNNMQATMSFHEIATGASANFVQWTPFLTHHVNYSLMWREILNVPATASWLIRTVTGHSLKSSITYTATHDRRDRPALPSKGHYLIASQEYAGLGGDVEFLKTRVEAKWWHLLPGAMVLGTTLQGGLLWPMRGGIPHPSDRFYLGGPLSLRGFSMKGAGPRDGGDALGGDVHFATGVSLRAPLSVLWKSLGPYLHVQAFGNAGNLVQYHKDKSLQENVQQLAGITPRISAGVGMLVSLGLARLEVNYCWLLARHPGDTGRGGVQFGLGVDFL